MAKPWQNFNFMTHHGHLVKSRLTIKHHQYVPDSLLFTSVNTKVKKLHSVCYIIRFWLFLCTQAPQSFCKCCSCNFHMFSLWVCCSPV